MTLQTEFESRRGKAYPEILSEIEAITRDVVMPIEGQDLRDVVTVLASGLDYRLQMAEPSPLRSGLMRAFNSMSINEFGFNLTDPVVVQLLDLGVSHGLIDVNERLWFYAIATKQVPKYPELKLGDVVGYFEPTKVNNDWITVTNHNKNTFSFILNESLPENSNIVIEIQEIYDNGTISDWYFGTTIRDVQLKRKYSVPVPVNSSICNIRYKSKYTLNITMSN